MQFITYLLHVLISDAFNHMTDTLQYIIFFVYKCCLSSHYPLDHMATLVVLSRLRKDPILC